MKKRTASVDGIVACKYIFLGGWEVSFWREVEGEGRGWAYMPGTRVELEDVPSMLDIP